MAIFHLRICHPWQIQCPPHRGHAQIRQELSLGFERIENPILRENRGERPEPEGLELFPMRIEDSRHHIASSLRVA
jgi:hypothetical protein